MIDRRMNTKKLALNGILGALAVICLLLATVLPVNRISLYALSSFFIAISIIESGIKAGWVFYAATSLLSLIIIPNKLGIVPYVVFFGLHGIVKYYIEKLDRILLEYILKFAYFNMCMIAVYWAAGSLFGIVVSAKLPWWVLIVLLELAFFVYDFVYTLFINYYRNKIKPLLKM